MQLKYRPELDSLRALSVALVIGFHYKIPGLAGGFVGVDVFFVISGFLITSILYAQRKEGTYSAREFYRRRAIRLLPALLLMLIVSSIFAWLLLMPREMYKFSLGLATTLAFLANIFYMRGAGYFQDDIDTLPLIHMWSLSVEEQFYLLFPLLMIALATKPTKTILYILAAVATTSLVLAQYANYEFAEKNYFLLPTRAWEILAGSILVFLPKPSSPPRLSSLLTLIGVSLIVFSAVLLDKDAAFPGIGAIPVVLGAALFIRYSNTASYIKNFLSFKYFVFIGLLSYPLYLWHQPLIAFFRIVTQREANGLEVIIVIGACLLLAYGTWKYVEKPIQENRFLNISRRTAILTPLLILFVMSIAIATNKGFPNRMPIQGWADRKHMSDKNCRNLVTTQQPERCILGDKSQLPTVAIWGDSIADSLMTEFSQHLAKQEKAGLGFIFHSCPSILDVLRNEPARKGIDFAQRCADYSGTVLSLLTRTPKIDTVVLTSNYRELIDLSAEGSQRLLIPKDEADTNLSDKELNSILIAKLATTAEVLLESGKNVIFILPYPTVPEMQNIIRSAWAARDYEMSGLIKNQSKVGEINRLITQELHKIESTSQLTIIDPNDAFCENSQCTMRSGNQLYLLDGSHLTEPAAKAIISLIPNKS